MAIFKCKMCGGTIEFKEGEKIGVCDSCGSKQTLPTVSDEVIATLHNRANILRLKSEFDKAEEIYDKILEKNPNDAEAHWGIILCKYGIEYVEDPETYKRVPTCHRASFEAIFADEDYKEAIRNADGEQRKLYETEAKEIERIQKDIISIAKKEKPFDVFICYKETGFDGKRTQDSVLANEIYYQLTQEGFKVFYAAITLEDKVGQEYEPYIFAALNSAKVMLVVGSKPEYFLTVWVKNEWSRFLKLMKNDRSKMLIPCYKDMDAYELPEEFAHLQAQDMSKIGFINDLVRGIKKVVNDSIPVSAVMGDVKENTNNVKVDTLLERVSIFLEDGKWQDANIYCEKVLDIDPKNAKAYLGKLMVELEVKYVKELAECKEPFDGSDNYSKVIRFGNEKLKKEIRGYITHINERNEENRLTNIYNKAINTMKMANSEKEFKYAANVFKSIGEFKDSNILYRQCLDKAEDCRKDMIYSSAISEMMGERVDSYEEAIKLFETISGWKDSDEKIHACQKKIEEIKCKMEAARIEAERQAEIKHKKSEERVRCIKRIVMISTPIVCLVIAFIIVYTNIIAPNIKYNNAVALMDEGNNGEAYKLFRELDGYKDSVENINLIKYNNAIELMDKGDNDGAYKLFKELGKYKDSVERVDSIKYNDAMAFMNEGNFIEAYEIWISLNDYKDSSEKAKSIYYKYKIEKIKAAKTGDYVKFGSYEQDNIISDGREDVEWLVLKKEYSKILMISKYGLDCKQYNKKNKIVSWKNCTLRKWLNNDFINKTFSEEEKSKISTTVVYTKNYRSYTWKDNSEYSTSDRVFLLDATEANEYFDSDDARQCEATEYALVNGANILNGNSWWWLRSTGFYWDTDYAYVGSDGKINDYGLRVNNAYSTVRPAMWVDLDN